MSYSCYKLDMNSRNHLMELYPPKYPAVRYDHITIEMLSTPDAPCPKPADSVEIVGIADDGNGIEAFIAKVNGSIRRPDGSIWHITASFDPEKKAPADFDIQSPPESRTEKPYKPVTSNGFLRQLIDENNQIKSNLNPNWSVYFFECPLPIKTKPVIQLSSAELKRLNPQNPRL